MTIDARELLDVVPQRWMRRVPGRETFAWPQPGAPSMVVKRTLGLEWRERWYERLRGRVARSPGRREYENLIALADLGFPVPRALGWGESGNGRARSGPSIVVMQYVPHRSNLRERIEREADLDLAAWCERVLHVVVRLHESGWYHRDLYLQHFLALEDPDALVLLDVGRARREHRPRRRWFVKDLAALAHSAPRRVSTFTRLRFLARYLDARGIPGRRARRAWARAIDSHRARMARHRPRHGEDDARGG